MKQKHIQKVRIYMGSGNKYIELTYILKVGTNTGEQVYIQRIKTHTKSGDIYGE